MSRPEEGTPGGAIQAFECPLADAGATDALGGALAAHRPPRGVLHLHGDLGAGKSTLARALLRSLGVRGTIRSPTYTLIERYALPGGGEAAHLDLYRLAAAGELDFLGLDELVAAADLWLVEWPERGGQQLPTADLTLHFQPMGGGRIVRAQPGTDVGAAWWTAAADTLT